MNILYRAFQGISHGNQLFAIKAGILTGQRLLLAFDDGVTNNVILREQHFSAFLHSSNRLLLSPMVCFCENGIAALAVVECIFARRAV